MVNGVGETVAGYKFQVAGPETRKPRNLFSLSEIEALQLVTCNL
jgi:hypothetical protein